MEFLVMVIDKEEQDQFLHFTLLRVAVEERDLKDPALTYSQKLIFLRHPLCMDHNLSVKVRHTSLTFQLDLTWGSKHLIFLKIRLIKNFSQCNNQQILVFQIKSTKNTTILL